MASHNAGNPPGGKPHDSNAFPPGAEPPMDIPEIVTDLASPRGSLELAHEQLAASKRDTLKIPDYLSSVGSPVSVESDCCSKVAEKLDRTMEMLHDHAAYCITLPGTGGHWDHEARKKLWPSRDLHEEMFATFREAIQHQQWPKEFGDIIIEGATSSIKELQTSFAREATELFANYPALDAAVKEFIRPKLGSILRLVEASRDAQARLASDDVDKPQEREFRKGCDDFFHGLLDNNNKRFTMAERMLNLPRNRFCDALRMGKDTYTIYSNVLGNLQERFGKYLEEMQVFAAHPAFEPPRQRRGRAATDERYTGTRFLQDTSNTQNKDVDFRFSLFRVAAAIAVDAEDAIATAWSDSQTKSYPKRMLWTPLTGTCDAFTFTTVDLNPHLPAQPASGMTRKELRSHLLRHCGLARLSDDELARTNANKPSPTPPKDKMFCPSIGRMVDPEDISDLMGAAALIAALQKLQRSTAVPKEPRTRQSITSKTIFDDLKLGEQTPLLLPLLIHEYKRNANSFKPQGGCQLRIYLLAACRFLELLGIIKFIVFGILLEGSSVVVLGAWKEGQDNETTRYPTWIVDHNTVCYDLTEPRDAYQFARFVSWVHKVHGAELVRRLKDENIKKFVDRVSNGEGPECHWTALHQNPRSTDKKAEGAAKK